jgi:TPR repeat protein
MRTLFIIPLVLMSLMSFPSWGETWSDGLEAATIGDFAKAKRIWMPLAEDGNMYAQESIGIMYLRGHGVYKSAPKAFEWFKRAATNGLNIGDRLGTMYANGEGVIQDYVYAHMWWNIAASIYGNKESADKRAKIQAVMTPSQIEKAQNLARECMAKNYKGC